MAETENTNGLNRTEQQTGDELRDVGQGAGKAMIDPRDTQNATQPGEARVNHPGATGGSRSDTDEPTLSQSGLDDSEDNFGNTRDPQEVADNNIGQYVTGRPV